jgi:hypothetical protein
LSETRITEDIDENELKIIGYELIICCSSSRHTGGAAIYINSSIKFELVSKKILGQNWFVTIKIIKGYKHGLYSALYHSPSESKKQFLIYLENWFDEVVDPKYFNCIVGDFNIDVSKNRYYSKKLINLYQLYGMTQIMSDYTRIDRNSKSIIDLVLINEDCFNASVLDIANIADHRTIVIEDQNSRHKKLKVFEKIEILDWKDYTKQKLVNELKKFDFKSIRSEPIHEKTVVLCEKISDAIDSLVTTKTINIMENNEWFDESLFFMQHERNVAYNLATFTELDEHWNEYRKIRNRYVKECNIKLNKDIEKTVDKFKKDSKKLWKVLRKLMKSTAKKPENIKFEDGIESDEQKIADKFNDYFISSIIEINNDIETSFSDPLNNITCSSNNIFKFKKIDFLYLKNIVKNLKNKSSSDKISAKVIKDSIDVIGYYQ